MVCIRGQASPQSRSVSRWLVGFCLFFIGGCGPGTIQSETSVPVSDSGNVTNGATARPAQPSGDSKALNPSPAPQQEEIQKVSLTFKGDVDDSLAALQVKSTLLLRATIDECFGKSTSTLLRKDMFAADNFLTPAEAGTFTALGKKQFISTASPYMSYVVVTTTGSGTAAISTVDFSGSKVPDVLEIEAPKMEDLAGSGRATAAADFLSDRYLRSMESVGQVVAHNCNLASQTCNCNTVDLATAMLRRCLPLIDLGSAQFLEAAKQMATQCAVGPLQTRQAIAALVGSYAFSLRR